MDPQEASIQDDGGSLVAAVAGTRANKCQHRGDAVNSNLVNRHDPFLSDEDRFLDVMEAAWPQIHKYLGLRCVGRVSAVNRQLRRLCTIEGKLKVNTISSEDYRNKRTTKLRMIFDNVCLPGVISFKFWLGGLGLFGIMSPRLAEPAQMLLFQLFVSKLSEFCNLESLHLDLGGFDKDWRTDQDSGQIHLENIRNLGESCARLERLQELNVVFPSPSVPSVGDEDGLGMGSATKKALAGVLRLQRLLRLEISGEHIPPHTNTEERDEFTEALILSCFNLKYLAVCLENRREAEKLMACVHETGANSDLFSIQHISLEFQFTMDHRAMLHALQFFGANNDLQTVKILYSIDKGFSEGVLPAERFLAKQFCDFLSQKRNLQYLEVYVYNDPFGDHVLRSLADIATQDFFTKPITMDIEAEMLRERKPELVRELREHFDKHRDVCTAKITSEISSSVRIILTTFPRRLPRRHIIGSSLAAKSTNLV